MDIMVIRLAGHSSPIQEDGKAAEIEFKHGYEREAEKNMMALAKAKEEVTAEQVEAGIAAVTEKQQETGGLMSKPEMES